MGKEKVIDRLKAKWGITSNIQIMLILIVFAINGSFAAWVASPATAFIGLDRATTHALIYWPLRILLIFPIYQLTLPIVGFLFGQFRFFWNFELRMLRTLGLVRKKSDS